MEFAHLLYQSRPRSGARFLRDIPVAVAREG